MGQLHSTRARRRRSARSVDTSNTGVTSSQTERRRNTSSSRRRGLALIRSFSGRSNASGQNTRSRRSNVASSLRRNNAGSNGGAGGSPIFAFESDIIGDDNEERGRSPTHPRNNARTSNRDGWRGLPILERLPSLVSMGEPSFAGSNWSLQDSSIVSYADSTTVSLQRGDSTRSVPRHDSSRSLNSREYPTRRLSSQLGRVNMDSLGVVSEETPTTPTNSSHGTATVTSSLSIVGPPELRIQYDPPSSGGDPTTPPSAPLDTSPGHHRTGSFRRGSVGSSVEGSVVSDMDEEEYNDDFFPLASPTKEWMSRSVESLILGHRSSAPLLQLVEETQQEDDASLDFLAFRRRSTASTFGGGHPRRRSSQGSFPGGRRGSLSLSGNMHGGTLANYYTRRRQVPTDVDRTYNERQGRRGSMNGPVYRRRSSMATSGQNEASKEESAQEEKEGPNILYSVMARESTGHSFFPRTVPATARLRIMGGASLHRSFDKRVAGMTSEVAFLAAAIDTGDWTEVHTIVSRLAYRLIGDPSRHGGSSDDPNLPPNAPKFYAGGGRLGLERDAFVQAGGVEVMIRMFREKSFVGQEMAFTYDARDLSEEIVATRLAPCWNEALASLRELVYYIPSIVTDGLISDNDEFLPFLFTLLAHDSCFDTAASLIEEILSLMSQTPQQPSSDEGALSTTYEPVGRTSLARTFFLGNVPELYKLWNGFTCRQLAHFCRILALLLFEPEDRQLLESPAVLKSIELLQIRRNRAARAGLDSTVDMNQSIILGDPELLKRLLKLLKVMNFAPSLRRFAPYHTMAHFPFIADTLIMLGLVEIDEWSEVDRQEALARQLLESKSREVDDEPSLNELASVADMLEELFEPLRQVNDPIVRVVRVVTAAQQSGIIVGRNRRRRSNNRPLPATAPSMTDDISDITWASLVLGDGPIDGASIQSVASVAGILRDQMRDQIMSRSGNTDTEHSGIGSFNDDYFGLRETRHLINTPEDAANSLQFNAMLLGPYQVELLFVLCTLLGGRRKLDAQQHMTEIQLIPVLEDMFQRLPWHARDPNGNNESANNPNEAHEHQPSGIHGPGCECTPESALCVQYLRLIHNFCDRDCDNYSGRRFLLSPMEKDAIFSNDQGQNLRGLLSKIIVAFIKESDDSPYRFWLASCVESYLRGSAPREQVFVARSGLLDHLVEDICSDKLHCAGSLQTSFDLLGELCKGNVEVVRLLVSGLDEEGFRKFMSVAAANLVDSNVFIRSLILGLERMAIQERSWPLYARLEQTGSVTGWQSHKGNGSRSYLTHSWWDTQAKTLLHTGSMIENSNEDPIDATRRSDWFPAREMAVVSTMAVPESVAIPAGLSESVGHFGWVFTPAGDQLSPETFLPNTVERLSWFLAANQARLLRDLLSVVDLRNINHENICCLNTAVVIAIFAHRRKQLAALLKELRKMDKEEKDLKRRAVTAANQGDVVDRAFAQAMAYLDLDQRRDTPAYARRASLAHGNSQSIGDRADVMRNFREVLWFWTEYYTHRGRDRLSLEFSSHLRFEEWHHVVSLLTADNDSSTSLVCSPVRLPRSPYQRAPRIPDTPQRVV